MRTRIFIGVAALALVLAGCGKDKTTDASTTKTTVAHGIAAKPAVQASTVAAFGKILTDGDGHTLYFFDKDQSTKPNSSCSGACASNWPALTTSDGAGVGDGLDAALLNHNAANQYTYNGWPLYRFSGDTAAGDTNGQGVAGIWHVAGADGNPVMTSAATTTTAASTAAPAAVRSTPTTTRPVAATVAPTSTPPTSPPATSPPTTAYQYPY